MQATTTITRKSLGTRIREAAQAQGRALDIVTDPQGWGRLMYSVDGSEARTPGETAAALGL